MTKSFRFDGQALNNNLVASIAYILDEANVPNVLWGNYLLTIFGVSTVVDVSSNDHVNEATGCEITNIIIGSRLRCTG